MPPLPEAIIQVSAPFAPLFSHRDWLHAQLLRLGAMLAPQAHTVTAIFRELRLAPTARPCGVFLALLSVGRSLGAAFGLFRCVSGVRAVEGYGEPI